MFTVDLVSQTGAIPVANPINTAAPEIVYAEQPEPEYDMWVSLVQPSDLVMRGKYVMDWDSDYRALSGLLLSVRNAYQQMVGKEGEFVLDFEYKKIKPGWLE